VGDGYDYVYQPGLTNGWVDWTKPDIGLTAEPPFWPQNTSAWSSNAIYWQGIHADMCNFGFVDGHAKALSLNVLAGGNNGYPSAGHPGYGALLWCSFPGGPNANG
jgi:prepilin-type processing-associated H-X9-DG protein